MAYIKTEAGICKAWVRLAINDGLMESYLSTMLSQPKVLAEYYGRTGEYKPLSLYHHPILASGVNEGLRAIE